MILGTWSDSKKLSNGVRLEGFRDEGDKHKVYDAEEGIWTSSVRRVFRARVLEEE